MHPITKINSIKTPFVILKRKVAFSELVLGWLTKVKDRKKIQLPFVCFAIEELVHGGGLGRHQRNRQDIILIPIEKRNTFSIFVLLSETIPR